MASNFNVGFVFGAKKASSFDKTFKSINQSIGSIVKGVAGVAAAAVSFNAIKGFAQECTAEAKAQIEAETKLGAVLQNVESVKAKGVNAYKDSLAVLNGVADKMEKVGVIAGDVTTAGFQQLATFQLSDKEIGILSAGMGDLLAQQKGLNATQGDAVTIGNMIGKAMNGQVGALSKVGISFTKAQAKAIKTGDSMLRAETIAKVLEQNVGGVNEALAATDQGQIKKAADAYGNIKEQIGKGILPIHARLSKAALAFLPIVEKVGTGLVRHIGNGIDWVVTNMDKARPVIDGIKTAFIYVGEKGKLAFDSIQAKVIELQPKFDAIKAIGITIGEKLKECFEKAQPAIDWMITQGLPIMVGFLTDVGQKAMDVVGFFAGWEGTVPIILGIVTALTLYKAIMLGVNIATKAGMIIKTLSNAWVIARGAIVMLQSGAKLATVSQFALQAAQKAGIITQGVMTAAQWAMNSAFLASPVTWIVLGIMALVAGFVLLWNKCEGFRNFFIGMWEGIKVAVGAVGTFFVGTWDMITGAFAGLGAFFTGIWDSVISGFKGFVNFIISGVNFMIKAVNKLQITVPDWVPLLGGETIGFSIPEIPMLAKGGVATAPTLAMVGEGREKEAILPLSKLDAMMTTAPTQSGVQVISFAPMMQLLEKYLAQNEQVKPSSITFAPVITIEGNASKEEIDMAMGEAYERFEAFMKKYELEKTRKKF